MADLFKIAAENDRKRSSFLKWAKSKGRKVNYRDYVDSRGGIGYAFRRLFGTQDDWDYEGDGVYKNLLLEDGKWFYGYYKNDQTHLYDIGLGQSKFQNAEEVFNYIHSSGGSTNRPKAYAKERSKTVTKTKDNMAINLLSQKLDRLSNVIAGNQEDYNLRIESAFTKLTDVLQSIQVSSQEPSVIQTLYLDRQAKTFLPSSIRDRGLAGALSSGVVG